MTSPVEEVRDLVCNINTDEELLEIDRLLDEVDDPLTVSDYYVSDGDEILRAAIRHGEITQYAMTTDTARYMTGGEETLGVEVDFTFYCDSGVLEEW